MGRRAQERERAEAAARAKRAEAERKAIAEAQKIVAIWNARQAGGRALWFYPTIGAAIAAGLSWLSFSCPACGQIRIGGHAHVGPTPGAAISSLIVCVVSAVCAERTVRSDRNVDGVQAMKTIVSQRFNRPSRLQEGCQDLLRN
jgi:hypothetical protein